MFQVTKLTFYASLRLFLNSDISSDDDSLQVSGCNVKRTDHQSNTKRERVLFIIGIFHL